MIFNILILLKFIIFTSITKVSFNRISVILISSLITGIIFYFIASRSKEKNKFRNVFIFYIIISIILLADSAYYGHFNSLPNILALKQAGQLSAVGDSIKYLLNFKLILLIIDIPIIILLRLKSKKNKRKNNSLKIRNEKSYLLTNIIMLIIVFSVVFVKGQFTSIKSQELYTYHLSDIKNTLFTKNNKDKTITDKDLLEIKERTKLKEGKHTGIAKNRNLIVLQIEGLQNFVVGLNYNNQEVTPNLNKLIKDDGSLYFNDYHQLLGRGNTSDAEFVTNNSLHPSMEEPTYSQYEKNTFYSLPNLLKDYGYTSWAFHGFEKSFWNREKAYVNQGFERFLSEEDYEFDKEDIIAFGIKDEDFYMQTIDYLKELDKVDDNPFYAFIISLSSHTPFTMPEKYNKLDILKEHDGNMVGDYIQSVHYADYAIGLFLDQLKEEGLYDNSVICIYGDHFGISAAQKEAPLVNSIIGREYDFDTMMNIPLIINIPGEDINETIAQTGSQIDFFPTILNLFGYENKKGLMFGRDLVNYKEDNIVMSQTYMLKGSFITKDLLFEISRDNVFEHSRLINRHTREVLDVEKARDISEYVNREINMSNYILKTDYFKEMKIDEKN